MAFRAAIIIEWGSAILAVWVSELFISKLPLQLQEYLQWQSEQEFTDTENIIFYASMFLLLACLITSIGLYLFKPWAKQAYIFVRVVALTAIVAMGPVVDHAFPSAIDTISTVMFGFILALLLYTNVYKTEQ